MTEIKKKPTIDDINEIGKYRANKYISSFGSWMKFLREIGEVTENGYHYPQGLHFGHILYILKSLYQKDKTGYMNEKYIKLRGNLDKNEDIAKFQRQTKYKIQGMMGMGLIVDDRKLGHDTKEIELTPNGRKLYELLRELIDSLDLSFKEKDKGISWEMNTLDFITPMQGIEIPSTEAAKHRVPFIILLLEIMDFVNTTRSEIKLSSILFNNKIFDDVEDSQIIEIANDYQKNNGENIEYLKEKIGLELINNKLKVEVI